MTFTTRLSAAVEGFRSDQTQLQIAKSKCLAKADHLLRVRDGWGTHPEGRERKADLFNQAKGLRDAAAIIAALTGEV